WHSARPPRGRLPVAPNSLQFHRSIRYGRQAGSGHRSGNGPGTLGSSAVLIQPNGPSLLGNRARRSLQDLDDPKARRTIGDGLRTSAHAIDEVLDFALQRLLGRD